MPGYNLEDGYNVDANGVFSYHSALGRLFTGIRYDGGGPSADSARSSGAQTRARRAAELRAAYETIANLNMVIKNSRGHVQEIADLKKQVNVLFTMHSESRDQIFVRNSENKHQQEYIETLLYLVNSSNDRVATLELELEASKTTTATIAEAYASLKASADQATSTDIARRNQEIVKLRAELVVARSAASVASVVAETSVSLDSDHPSPVQASISSPLRRALSPSSTAWISSPPAQAAAAAASTVARVVDQSPSSSGGGLSPAASPAEATQLPVAAAVGSASASPAGSVGVPFPYWPVEAQAWATETLSEAKSGLAACVWGRIVHILELAYPPGHVPVPWNPSQAYHLASRAWNALNPASAPGQAAGPAPSWYSIYRQAWTEDVAGWQQDKENARLAEKAAKSAAKAAAKAQSRG